MKQLKFTKAMNTDLNIFESKNSKICKYTVSKYPPKFKIPFFQHAVTIYLATFLANPDPLSCSTWGPV